MQFRSLGNTDLKLPVVSFGAWAIGGWMWGGSDDSAAIRAIQCAIDEGISCVDTAPAYGFGHSEVVVGQAIAGRRDQVLVATKCGLRWDSTEGQHHYDTSFQGKPQTLYRNLRAASIKQECEASLRRMNIEVIDLYQCHWPDPTTPVEESMGALLDLQAEGKIRAFGVSNYSIEMMEDCLKIAPIASNQPKYNALEREIEDDILPFCKKNSIGVLAYSPIAQGLLSGKVSVERVFDPEDQRSSKPMFSRENRQKVLAMLEQIKPIADRHALTFSQLFIAWTVAQAGLSSALVGARNEAQVKENAAAGDVALAPEELASIRKALEGLELTF